MIDIASSLSVVEDLRYLSQSRQYWQLAEKLSVLPKERLISERDLGFYLAVAYLHLRRSREGLELTGDLLSATSTASDTFLTRRIELLRSVFLGREGYLDAAENAALHCLEGWDWTNQNSFAASATNSLGVVYCLRGEWESAIPQLQRALAVYAQVGDRFGVAAVNHNLGLANRYMGYCEQAEKFFLAAAAYYDSDGILEEAIFSEAERSLAVLGMGDGRLARRMAERALERCRRIGNKELLVETLRVMGIVFRDLGAFSEARLRFGEAARVARRNRNMQQVAEVLLERGLLERKVGRKEAFLNDVRRAKGYFERIGATGFVRVAADSMTM